MKKLFSIILSIAVGFLTFGAADVYYFGENAALAAFADETSGTSEPANPTEPANSSEPTAPVTPVSNEITSENVSLEYTSISFNGGIRKPAVTVKLGETTLKEGVDFTVKYPENCTDAGKKTVVISGKGNFKGEARTSYEIVPLDCSDNPDVTVKVGNCRYNGLPQYPEITVKIGDYVIPKTDYTVSLSDNVEVSTEKKKALCTLKFRGNCTGERTEEFNVIKKESMDLWVYIMAKRGQTFSIDLTPLKPTGAFLGNPIFLSSDFSPSNQPKIAFNMLKFTLEQSTTITIPMKNIANCEDSWLEFYIETTELEIPSLVLKPLTKTYDGEPFKVSDLKNSGSYAHINGEVIEGKWRFVTESINTMTLPCGKTFVLVKFTPSDPQYSYAYGLASASILRKEASEFDVHCNTKKLYTGQILKLSLKGIPDDFDGKAAVTAAEDNKSDEFKILSEKETPNGREYEIDFPFKDAYHTLNVTLSGSAFYAPKTIEVKVKVGDPPAETQDNVPTTESQLMELIAKAEPDSTVKANLMTYISEEALNAADEKRITIEVKENDVITYVLEPAKMKSISSLNLTTSTAVIPKVLFDKQGDNEIYSFTTFTSFLKGNGGVSIKAEIASKPKLPNICFYKYGTSGELEHITSVPGRKGTVQFELPGSGKFTITESNSSHIFRDLNNDCVINRQDVVIALKTFLLMTDKPSAEQLETLDFNHDGEFTRQDIVTLLRYCLIGK